jgi:flavorubredoxin
LIAYTSVYGNTEQAVKLLAETLAQKGCKNVVVHDLARTDMSLAVANAFRLSKIVLATTTYNADIFPFMKEFIEHLTERNFQNRTLALIENGSWAPMAAKVIKSLLEKSKNISYIEPTVTIKSAIDDAARKQIVAVADALCL